VLRKADDDKEAQLRQAADTAEAEARQAGDDATLLEANNHTDTAITMYVAFWSNTHIHNHALSYAHRQQIMIQHNTRNDCV
jgi:hypothetical protein